MRTHIELDDHLLSQVIHLGNFSTKKAAIHAALTEFAKLLKRRRLLELRGRVRWEGDLDKLRSRRNKEPG